VAFTGRPAFRKRIGLRGTATRTTRTTAKMASVPARNATLKRSLRLALLPLLLGAGSTLAVEPLGTPDPAAIEYPDGLPPSPSLVELGRQLFFETRLSSDQQHSCASCHLPELGLGDGLRRGHGSSGNRLTRHTPPLYNLAWNVSFFWDGRASTLEEQALQPIQDPNEMNLPLEHMIRNLSDISAYRAQFRQAFGSGEISAERVAQALAGFQRTLNSTNAAFDRYLAGDRSAMSPEAVRGLALFEGKANCMACHDGPNLTDNSFHNIGLGDKDRGRATIVKDAKLTGAFKTPGLRNVALTAPYMHDGSLATLEDVVRHYNKGGKKSPHLDKQMKPLNLSEQDIQDLVAFMGALTDPVPVARPAPHN
jgi:cytochrome c peroxidase